MSKLENKVAEIKPLGKVKAIADKPIVKRILENALLALYSYAVIFIIGQAFISGGMSEKNVYFIIAICIFLIASQIAFIRNSHYSSFKSTLVSSLTALLVFALLDYLLINLWLEKNNYELYKFWPNYFIYLIVVATPFIRSRWQNLNSPTLKSLLTKKAWTL